MGCGRDGHRWPRHQDAALNDQVHHAIRAETASIRESIDEDRAAYTRDIIGEEAADALDDARGKRETKRKRNSRKAQKIEAAKAKKAQAELFATAEPATEDGPQPASAGVPEVHVAPPAAAKRPAAAATVIPFNRPRRPAVVRLIDTSIAGSR
jgi:hypothetical protein